MAAQRRDVYVASERTGRFLHLSVHDPEYGSHLKVTSKRGTQVVAVISITRYPPGVTRVASIYVPSGALTYPPIANRAVRMMPSPASIEQWATFEILLEEQGVARDEWWPGVAVGAQLVDRLSVSDGSTVAVVYGPTPALTGSLTFAPAAEDLAAARAAIGAGIARALVQGRSQDGALWFLEVIPEAESRAEADNT